MVSAQPVNIFLHSGQKEVLFGLFFLHCSQYLPIYFFWGEDSSVQFHWLPHCYLLKKKTAILITDNGLLGCLWEYLYFIFNSLKFFCQIFFFFFFFAYQ